jgi:iron complex outermembrane receptor protein
MFSAKTRLFAGSLLSCVALSAFAGIAEAQPAPDATVGELIVTGSRLARATDETPNPVTVVSRQAMDNSGLTNLGDILAQLPALQGSATVRANSDRATNRGGLSLPDLRHLGTSRTLTLVDGQRSVGGVAGDMAVDLSTIPTALVDRVEVMTGGASAIYGSDAVTGVINVILKDHFEGLEAGFQRGGPLNGRYGQSTSAYAVGGQNFAGGRGNVIVSLFGDRQDRVKGSDIEGLADWGTVINPANTGPNDGIADTLYRPYVQADVFDEYGVITTTSLAPVTGFDAAGNPVKPPARTGTNSSIYGSFAAPCATCVSQEALGTPIPRQTRWGAQSIVHFDVSEALSLKADVQYVDTHTLDTASPSFTLGSYVLVPSTNPFVTPAIAAALAGRGSVFLVNRMNLDVGPRNTDTDRQTFRAVLGANGKADAGFADVKWQANYNFGRTVARFDTENVLVPRAFAAAIDAVRDPVTGAARCRTDPGVLGRTCTPFNLFGAQNSAAALAYVSTSVDAKQSLTQQVANATATFDTSRFFNLAGGPVGLAAGVEWRSEQSRSTPGTLLQSGLTELTPTSNATGGFEVREAFMEAEAPILKDAPFAKALTLNAAVRFADYSHAGDATSWALRGLWAPIDDLAFRATYSRAVRAPNINEAFLPSTSGFQTIQDPCTTLRMGDNANRPANCRALGVAFTSATGTSFPGISAGNPDLKSEKADTWTVGFVLTPSFAPGLMASVDYYDIKIDDAISLLTGQDAANQCVDGPTLAAAYCALITRNPTTKQITGYRSTYLNQSALKTAGYDILVSYGHDVAFMALNGRATGSVSANYVEKLRQYAFQDFPNVVDREEGELGDPRWSATSSLSYAQGPVTLTWESRFMDEVRRNKDVSPERTDRPTVESVWYHDLIARFAVNRGKGSEIYVGVNNIFAKTLPVGITGQADPIYAYDLFGRYLFAGVKARF